MNRARSSSAATSTTHLAPQSTPVNSHHPDQPLQVKVLRLARPVPQNVMNPQNVEAPSLPTTELLLPKAVHSVFVGEEFQCLLAIQKTGNVDDNSVSVVAEVVTPHGNRSELLHSDVQWNDEFVRLLSFDAAESGVYTLAVTVRYEEDLEHRAFRRLFKFEATPAISVRMKVSRGSSALKGHVLEAQVENLSGATLTVESCVLSPSHNWEITKLEAVEPEESVVLRPRDIQQWCYVLRNGSKQEVGQLSVGWRMEPLGSKGWQTTGMIRI